MSSSDLRGRRVLVTGASSGLGSAIAVTLAEAGAAVACLARRADRVAALAESIDGVAVPADISDDVAAGAAVERAADMLGGLDGLVNDAGVMLHSRVSMGLVQDWRTMLEVNVLGLLNMCSAAIPHLRSTGRGDIINVTSTSAHRVAVPDYGLYAATKSAVNYISLGLRQELAPDGIRVSLITPGLMRDTEMGPGVRDPDLRAALDKQVKAMGMEPELVAREIAHMMSLPAHVRINDLQIVPHDQVT